jgi:quercetin dioxygenase-like cupin family protein
MADTPRVTPWPGPHAPTEDIIRRLLDTEGLTYYKWGNPPLDVYQAHTHTYNKVIYVVAGAVTFGLPAEGIKLTLKVGDRLDLPRGIVHEATVSALGVECLEAHYDYRVPHKR